MKMYILTHWYWISRCSLLMHTHIKYLYFSICFNNKKLKTQAYGSNEATDNCLFTDSNHRPTSSWLGTIVELCDIHDSQSAFILFIIYVLIIICIVLKRSWESTDKISGRFPLPISCCFNWFSFSYKTCNFMFLR